MKHRRVQHLWCITLAVVALATPLTAQQSARIAPADILILHAKVYTLNPQAPWAQAVAIRHGKIVAVGRDEVVGKMRGIGTKVIDAGGRLALPGFTDCHVHFLEGSLALGRVSLDGLTTVAEIQKRLMEYAREHPGDSWILGRGWNYAVFGELALPDKRYLDELFPDRPVFLEGFDGHSYWVNSKALALAGVTRTTPDPKNGFIVRDPETGEPTGALEEDADALVRKAIPKLEELDKLKALRAGLKWANQNGITRVHSAGGDFEALPLLCQLRDDKQLSVRFYVSYRLDAYELRKEDLEAIESARKKYRDEWIDANAVKMMLDGVVETHTAALLAPYADRPSTKGALFWELPNYQYAVSELDKRGIELFTHAVGDYAVRTALDTYEMAGKKNHSKDRRPRIERIETIDDTDIARFGKLGVIASMQPLHSYPDADTLEVWARNLGPERASRAWVWKTIATDGGHYAFGSDWPIVTLNPWEGLQTAVTRQTKDGKPAGGFVPSERLTVAQAVSGYTIDAAYAGRREKTEGSIETGKVGDIIIVDRNIFEIEPHGIGATKVVFTIVGGKIVYETENH
ncbi:MAG TPA: amidohydrolase [Candidatus Acidoferrum sp.]|nr:amidohydrolase [Candidatus Acidoferrum sp.]